MNCPSCNTPNPDGSRFCLRCGNPIPAQSASPTPQPPPAYPPSQPPGSAPVRSMRPLGGGQPPAQMPSQQPPAPQPAYPPPASGAPQTIRAPQETPLYNSQTPQSPQYPQNPAQQPYPQSYQQPYQPQQYAAPSSSQISMSPLNIWGPFAGYGTRRRHIGWLMDGQAGRHVDLLKSINKRLKERQIPGVDIQWQTLTAKGVLVETRPYFLICKGLVTLGLNIGIFGKDLFISIATYLKPPISSFRVILAGISALFFLAGGPLIGGILSAASSNISLMGGSRSSAALDTILTTLCCLVPIWGLNAIIFPALLLFSAYKWLTEKDFFSLLRVKPNEFNEDDLMALEKAVEQTVRSSLDEIGLNPADLKPAAVQGSEVRLI